ncbi:acyl-CoA dehydrogenase family protein [Nostocoides jenkinsii]|uniref:Protein aidB n=1 Tax=Nostocoides jenkinsii Ben 74 TaxID=1193518 RepID=A0A077M3V5_9MICO|nr:acyl-CoA dehydrogenase family protein [Tetrasphaera jenkinsii]CCI51871.1 Protein aidB [Tetrasphaera jenkinsii Ben 74]
MTTHEVRNQPPPFGGYDLLAGDPALVAALDRWSPSRGDVTELARLAATSDPARWADQADTYPPVLRTHDAVGNRLDEVDYHPAYHALMTVAVGHGLGAEPWLANAGTGAHVRRATGFYLWSQVENAHLCPVSMTYAAGPALRHTPALAGEWLPRLASRVYDPRLVPVADKAGAIVGMGMTEKQGGSDVRANTTTATPDVAGPLGSDSVRLTGHKWFCSAPMSDGFLVLAQGPDGLGCYLLPRVLPDGTRNAFAIQRLKNKLGNRANASSEVEFAGTWATPVGEPGRGIRTILDMVAATRLDCILGSAATIRQALARAVHHTQHRAAFGATLIDQPLMRNVLADLAVESEAATLLALRLAHAIDEGESDFARLGVAIGKFWVCKRTSPAVAEALECLGGLGYIEENGLARLYREAPLNSIWEGSGNVNALDVLRAITREPASLAALAKECALARGAISLVDTAIDEIESVSTQAYAADAPWLARSLVERLALTLQASLLVRYAPPEVAEAFALTRLGPDRGLTFGTLPAAIASGAPGRILIDRATPRR